MDSNELVRKIQSIEKEILDDIVEVCNDAKIDYFLDGGTLLGAQRHKGFIPWDDDIDIGIHKDDWNDFESLIVNKLSDKYIIQSERGSVKIDSLRPCLKVNWRQSYTLDKDTDSYRNFPQQDQHIFVDVFRFSNVPESKRTTTFLWLLLKNIALFKEARRVKVLDLVKKEYGMNKFLFSLIWILFPIFKFVFWFIGIFEQQILDYYYKKAKDSKYIGFDVSHWRNMKPIHIPYELVYPVKKNNVSFEKDTYSSPNMPNEYLEFRYGNWKKLPPKENRSFQHFYYVEFEEKA